MGDIEIRNMLDLLYVVMNMKLQFSGVLLYLAGLL